MTTLTVLEPGYVPCCASLDAELFEREGIEVTWQNLRHPVYPQLHGEFVSHLSVLDLTLNCGEKCVAALAAAGAERP